MKIKKKNLFSFGSILFLVYSCSQPETQVKLNYNYPKARKTDTTDNYFGSKIPDPYRWLEDDNSAETAAWVKEQNAITDEYLSHIPFRDAVKKRLRELWNFEKYSTPFKKGKYYFFYKNNGLQNQSVLYFQEGMNAPPKILIDPNTLSSDGTVSLSGISVRKDAKYMAYNLSKAGSDWSEIHVLEIATRKVLSDTIRWVKFSGASWRGDGFYYSRYPEPMKGKAYLESNEHNKVYYHRIGTKQTEDKLIYEDVKNPQRSYNVDITEDEKIMLLFSSESTSGTSLKVKRLTDKNAPFIAIDDSFKYEYNILDNDENSLTVLTNNGAPNNKLVKIYLKEPEKQKWVILIPEKKDLLQSVSLCGGKLIVKYLKDVVSRFYVYSPEGKEEKEIQLPGLGVADISSDKKETVAFYSFVNFTRPATIYKYDLNSNSSDIYFQPKINFNSDDFETKQVFYSSKDGTKIPMFITHKKGLKLDGNNPVFLYGYGGFNISLAPEFRIDRAVFLENGGVYAVPNLRGGGEYGEEWHKAGTVCNKQNVFDDFIAAAEYLIREKYTTSAKLAIHGRSNGGLLVGAVMTQRPELAKVVVPGVGVLDMLRFHKFTIGRYWTTDYGCSSDKQQFECLLRYSPLHNIKETNYPATIITTGDHDDRVVPAHSFKFAAALQEKQKGIAPVLIRIDVNAGHGAGKPTTKLIDEWTDVWAFVFEHLGMKPEIKK